jgi:hypothetical protein
MKLDDYYDSLRGDQREAICRAAKTSVDYLYQICKGYRKPSPGLARRLEQATTLNKAFWRPDLWG